MYASFVNVQELSEAIIDLHIINSQEEVASSNNRTPARVGGKVIGAVPSLAKVEDSAFYQGEC